MPSSIQLHSDSIQREMGVRAARSLLWLALREAQLLGWHDVVDASCLLLQLVDQRLRAADCQAWQSRLHVEGPNQPESAL